MYVLDFNEDMEGLTHNIYDFSLKDEESFSQRSNTDVDMVSSM